MLIKYDHTLSHVEYYSCLTVYAANMLAVVLESFHFGVVVIAPSTLETSHRCSLDATVAPECLYILGFCCTAYVGFFLGAN